MKIKGLKLTWRNILFFLILLNPVCALFLDNFVYYSYVIEPLFMILLLVNSSNRGLYISRRNMLVLLVTFLSVIYAISIGSPLGKIYIHLFCYLDTIYMFYYFSRRDNADSFYVYLQNHTFAIKTIVILANIVELYMIITRKGYVNRFHWGGNFFQGTSSMPHTLSYLMLIVVALVIILLMIEKKRIYVLGAIVPLYAIFISGARITLILAVPFLVMIIDLCLTRKQKSVVVKILVALIVVSVGLFLLRNRIMSSNLWTKLMVRSGSSYEVTAGRTEIWFGLIRGYFNDMNTISKVIGAGDDKTYYFNAINPTVLHEVWAHNDFLQILIGKGILGLFAYTVAMISFFRAIIKNHRSLFTWMIIGLIFAAAALNGFYSYRDTALGVPLFAIIGYYYGNEREGVQFIRNKAKTYQ